MFRLALHQILGQSFGERVRIGPVLAQVLADRIQQVLVQIVVQIHSHRTSDGHLVELLVDLVPVAVRVRRRHVDKGREILDLIAEIYGRLRAQQVDAHCNGHFLVEAHSSGHMEDHVDPIAQQILIVLRHAHVPQAAVAGDRVDLVAELGLFRLQLIEQAVLEDGVDTGLHVLALLIPDQHVDGIDSGTGAQQLLNDDWMAEERTGTDFNNKFGWCDFSASRGWLANR